VKQDSHPGDLIIVLGKKNEYNPKKVSVSQDNNNKNIRMNAEVEEGVSLNKADKHLRIYFPRSKVDSFIRKVN